MEWSDMYGMAPCHHWKMQCLFNYSIFHPLNLLQIGMCSRVAQYQFFLIDSISIILFPFLSIPISISINLKRAYQYQYVINYWKIPLSISISISINLLPYQYRYQYFSTCLKSSYYKSAAAQISRQRSLESITSLDKVYTSFLYPTTQLTSTNHTCEYLDF